MTNRLQKTQSMRNIDKRSVDDAPISPFTIRPASFLQTKLNESNRPVSSYMNKKSAGVMPSNQRVNSGDIFNSKIVKKMRNENMKACQSDNKVGLGVGKKPTGHNLPSDSSNIGITTQLGRGKQTDASTNMSRPQSGNATLLGRRNYNGPLHQFPTRDNSNNIFSIDIN